MNLDNKDWSCINCSRMSPEFRKLTPEELAMVNKCKTHVTYQAGEIIVKQGTPMNHVISFTTGIAKVYIEGINNRNLILHFLKPTQFLGGPGIYFDDKHSFSVAAIERSSVCFIDLQVFKSLIRKNPDFADAFMKYISRNGIFNYQKFISLTQKNMHGRIADALLYLKNEIYTLKDSEINITRQDLAEFTGMSKDSAIRILKDLSSDSIIELVGKRIKVLDQERLTRLSEIG